MVWQPLPEEAQYYNTPAPADSQSALGELLTQVRGHGADPTFGRSTLPRAPVELALYEEHKTRQRKVLVGRKDGSEWVSYQVWEPKEGVEAKGELTLVQSVQPRGELC